MTTYTWPLTPTTPVTPPTYPVSELPASDKVLALVTAPFQNGQSLPVVFCTALATEIAEWATAAMQVRDVWDLDTVTGVQLDRIGHLLNKSRGAYDDDEYRATLKAWILAIKSSGLVEQLDAVVEQALSAFSANEFEIRDIPPKGFLVIIIDELTGDPQIIADLLELAKQGGTSASVSYTIYSAATTFTLGGTTAQGFGNGHLAGVVAA